MVNTRIGLPSQRGIDINEIRPKGYLPKRFKATWLGAMVELVAVLTLVGIVLGVIWVAFWVFSVPTATAKTLEAKDCMTNECVLKVVCGGESNYTNVEEICHG